MGILTLPFAKPGYMPRTAGTFLMSDPAQFLVGKCEFTMAGLGIESKAVQFHGTVGTMLRSKHGT